MGYVRLDIKTVACKEDLQKWEEHMMEQAKCWNKFCLGLYNENEIRAVNVIKEDKNDITYLTTLCEDCIKQNASYGILVNEKHLMVEHHPDDIESK